MAMTGVAAGAIAVAALRARSAADRAAASAPVVVGPALKPVVPSDRPAPQVQFTDVTEAAGIRFRHANGSFGKRLLPETMGAGVAFLDYDNDGDPDLLFVNSCHWPGHEPADGPAATFALYRNRGGGQFEDTTASAGLGVTMYGMGVTAGDYDNDGWIDLFLTGLGGNRLFRNVADGDGRRFVDVTDSAGVAGPGGWPGNVTNAEFLAISTPICFSSSAAFFDYDGDARLDLFVCNYVTWSPQFDLRQGFQLTGLGRSYGPPTVFEGAQCLLYHQEEGRFREVSAPSGLHVCGPIGQPVGKSLGVVTCDADDDGRPDIVVANDTVRNFLFHNQGGGRFRERGEETGVAYADGRARGAMGIDWAEYRPGLPALAIGNFADEPNTFLRRDCRDPLLFSDAAVAEGIAGASRTPLKFSTFFFDADLDGAVDLLTCNGHLEPEIHQVQASQTYAQPAQLFWNVAVGRRGGFVVATAKDAGADLFRPMVGRGSAYADIDSDGDLDVVLTQNNGPARLLRNDGGNRNHWVRLVLEGDGRRANTSAIGAKVTIEAGGRVQHRELLSARGYLSQSELALTFGLGRANKLDCLTIRWPGDPPGAEQQLADLPADKVYRIRQEPSTKGATP
jgi:hypothetical protein